MNNEQLVLRAFPTNTFTTDETAAGYINPQIWNKKIEDFARVNLVVAPLGVQNEELLSKPGFQLNIAKDAALTAAALTETTTISPQALSYGQATVTPTEYGGAFQISRKEMDRAFNNLLDEKASIAGYALAKIKDETIYAGLVSGATTTRRVNGQAADTDIASTDVFETDLIADGVTDMRKLNRNPIYMVIHPQQENGLIKSSQFIDASQYGGSSVVMTGEIGKYLGLRVFSSTTATTFTAASAGTGYNALLLGARSFVHARKRLPTIDSKYEPLDRAFTVAYVEDWGYAVLNADEIVVLKSQ